MNGSTSVSPVHRPNLCACGHDLRVHDLTVSPNTCALCIRNSAIGSALNVHNFTPYHDSGDPFPPTWFPTRPPPGYVCAGGFGVYSNGPGTLSSSGNAAGSTTITMAVSAAVLATLKPGMTLVTNPNNPANQASYRIVAINGQVLTLDRPLVVATNSVRCTFAGVLGSTMGPALAPNGQRAG